VGYSQSCCYAYSVNAIDEYVSAACIMRTLTYVCWLLLDFNEQYEDMRLDDGPLFFADMTLFLLRSFV
jgi:hypothetical protein